MRTTLCSTLLLTTLALAPGAAQQPSPAPAAAGADALAADIAKDWEAQKARMIAVAEAIAESACLTAQKLNASVIVCLTTSGKTATLIARFRPSQSRR